MIEAYLDRLTHFNPVSEESRNLLKKHIYTQKVAKGDFILKYREVCNAIYFIQSGFARQYYFKDGKDITEWFAGEQEFCFSISSYFQSTPSNLMIEALEDSTVIYLDKKGFTALTQTHLDLAQLAITMFSRSLIFSQERTESILFQSAKDRYLNLLKKQPHILQQVSLAHIASFLGITQETLSRIRAKI